MLELDELWSFVGGKAQTFWLWVALCRRTRQVVAWTLGDCGAQSACDLRAALPKDYRRCSYPQRPLGSLRRRFSRPHPPRLRQRAGRDQLRRALVWHVAGQDQPPGAPGVFLFETRREPPRRHPPFYHRLQPRHPAQNNRQVAIILIVYDSTASAVANQPRKGHYLLDPGVFTFTYTHADLLSDFGTEPANFYVRLWSKQNGRRSFSFVDCVVNRT